MTAESAADRLAFFDTDDFGENVTIGSTSVAGIFDDEYFAMELGQADVGSNSPAFHCRTADLPAITWNSTTLVRGATTYVIVEARPDGTGLTVLRLRENS